MRLLKKKNDFVRSVSLDFESSYELEKSSVIYEITLLFLNG